MSISPTDIARLDSPVVYVITLQQAEEFAEANLDVPLTKREKCNLAVAFIEGTDNYPFIDETIRYMRSETC